MGRELGFRTFLVHRMDHRCAEGTGVWDYCGMDWACEDRDVHLPASASGSSKKAIRCRSRSGHIFIGRLPGLELLISFCAAF